MAVFTYLDLSTKYITLEDSKKLNDSARAEPLIVNPNGEYGWFIHVPQEDNDMSDLVYKLRELGYSEAFCNVLQFARNQKCFWLCLDQDGEGDVDFLPTFEW